MALDHRFQTLNVNEHPLQRVYAIHHQIVRARCELGGRRSHMFYVFVHILNGTLVPIAAGILNVCATNHNNDGSVDPRKTPHYRHTDLAEQCTAATVHGCQYSATGNLEKSLKREYVVAASTPTPCLWKCSCIIGALNL